MQHLKPFAIIRGKIMSLFEESLLSWLQLHITTTLYVRQVFFVSFFEKNWKTSKISHIYCDNYLQFFANLSILCLQKWVLWKIRMPKTYKFDIWNCKTDNLMLYFEKARLVASNWYKIANLYRKNSRRFIKNIAPDRRELPSEAKKS